MNKKIIYSGLMLGALGLIIPAMAVTASAFSSELKIQTEATTIDVTVPGQAAMIFNEDGSNTVPLNFKVVNNSQIAGIYMSEIDLDAGVSGWKIVNPTVDLKTMPVDSKAIRLAMGEQGNEKAAVPTAGTEDSTAKITYGVKGFVVPSANEKIINFDVERGAFSKNIPAGDAFTMNLNFEFAVGESYMTTGTDFQTKISTMKATADSVAFVNTLDGVPGDAVDVSALDNDTVKAYLEGTTLKIAFEDSLVLNQDSSHLFEGINMREGLTGTEYLDSSKVVNASYMYANAKLASGETFKWMNVSKIEDASHMFDGTGGSGLIIDGFNFQSAKNVTNMFGLKSQGRITNLKFPSVTNADKMFYGVHLYPENPIDNIYLENATSARYMFGSDGGDSIGVGYSYATIGTIHFSEKLKDVSYMFYGFGGLNPSSTPKNLDMRNWGMSGVTTANYFMKRFAGDDVTIYLFDTRSLTSASHMFDNGLYSGSLNLEHCNFSKLVNADYMLSNMAGCTILMNNKTFPKLTSAEGMFKDTVFDRGGLNVSNLSFPMLENANYMLSFRSVYENIIDISSFKFGNLVTANHMVENHNLPSGFDVSNWGDMSRLQEANYMLSAGYQNRSVLGLSKWNLSSLISAENFISNHPYLNDSITIRNANSNITFNYIALADNAKLVINYVDEATKVKAEEIIQTAKTTSSMMKIELGEKVS